MFPQKRRNPTPNPSPQARRGKSTPPSFHPSPQARRGKSTPPSLLAQRGVRGVRLFQSIILLGILVIFTTNTPVASAHKVTTAADVGATLHLEPNDNPRAGEATKTWFALTRKGGKAIALAECNCQLVVYAEPHSPKEPPLLEPPLQPVAAERYQGIPGTEITFPRPGAYQLQLSGKPKDGRSFQPFELKFAVTVAAGSVSTELPVNVQNVNQNLENVTEGQTQGIPLWAIALSGLLAVGVFFGVLRMVKRR